MNNINRSFSDLSEMETYIADCEENFFSQVKAASLEICGDKSVKFILLSGPTCSGKTTTAGKICEELEKAGKNVKVISIDDFYLSRDFINGENIDFESAEAIDLDYFAECIEKLSAKKPTQLPVFDFVSGVRTGYVNFTPTDDTIIVFEGIQALYPEIASLIPSESRKIVFVNVFDDFYAYNRAFTREEIRFWRRMIRDYKFRGASPDTTLKLWQNVVANEKKNIIPNIPMADIKIDSFLPYEINVIGRYLTKEITYDINNKNETLLCDTFRHIFDTIPQIPGELVPSTSVFREFIG